MINKSSLLAIRALTELVPLKDGEWAGAASVARRINAPANYLGKILQSLVSHGLVVSQKGLGGGFRLNREARSISLYDIVSSIEDVERWSKCFLGRKKCMDSSPCALHNRWKEVREANVRFLQSITLSDLGGG